MTVTPARAEPVPFVRERDAGLATRLLAFAADALLIDAVVWLVGGAVAVAASVLGIPDTAGQALLGAGAGLGVLWAGGYFVFFWSTTGQTPGNRVMQIRVRDVREDRPVRPARAVLRLLGAVLSALLLGLGFLLILIEPRRRGLHDLIGRSVVVYEPRSARASRPPIDSSSRRRS